MIGEELRQRSHQFALAVVQLCLDLDPGALARLVQPQLLRSGTGVATNYRAACRARSSKEFASRLAIVVEEADESEFWLSVLLHQKFGPPQRTSTLRTEAAELRAIFSASRRTVLDRLKRRTKSPNR
jgi:four helix bundle protein